MQYMFDVKDILQSALLFQCGCVLPQCQLPECMLLRSSVEEIDLPVLKIQNAISNTPPRSVSSSTSVRKYATISKKES